MSFALLALVASVRADLPTVRLATLFPPGGRTGATLEVEITGADLDDTTTLWFSHPGITAKPKQPTRFEVTIAASVPIGQYEARVAGRFGVSNPRAFVVGDLPETASGPDVLLNSVINTRCTAATVDQHRFTAEKGQRILIDCAARSIDSRLEPVLTLTDGTGRELERDRQGGLIDFTAPADGVYTLRLHDLLHRGGPEYFYRLTLSTAPRIDLVFPPSAAPGTRSRFTLFGRNLPGGVPISEKLNGKPVEKIDVEIDVPPAATQPSADPATEGFEYRLRTDQGTSNSAFIAFSTDPLIIEQGGDVEPQRLRIPCEYAGRLYPRRDADWFTFEGSKGDVYWIEVISHRQHYPSDPYLLLQRATKNDKGEPTWADLQEVYDTDPNVPGSEHRLPSRDVSLRFEATETGLYRLLVRDLSNNTADDPRRIYRLSIRKPRPDFRLIATTASPFGPRATDAKIPPGPAAGTLLRKGGTLPLKVAVHRRDGFDADVELRAESLPPGVTCPPVTIPAGSNLGVLMLCAAEDTANWTGPIRIAGTSTIAGQPAARQALPASVIWPITDATQEAPRSRIAAGALITAIADQPQPLTLAPAATQPVEAQVASKVKLPVKLHRRADTSGKLKLRLIGHPLLDAFKEIEADGKSPDVTIDLDLAQHKLPPGLHTIHVQAQATVKYSRDADALKAAEAAKSSADGLVTQRQAQAKQAAEAKAAAAKASSESAATVPLAAAAAASAIKTAEQSIAEAKAALDELAKVRITVDAGPRDPAALETLAAAARRAAEASDKAASAARARAAAESAQSTASSRAQESAQALAAATAAESHAANQLKDAEKQRDEAAARVKAFAPKDTAGTFYSAPIFIRVTPPPPATQPTPKP